MSENKTTGRADTTAARTVPDYSENVGKRDFPGAVDLLRPRYLVGWFVGFVEGWFISRPYWRLVAGLPFLLIGVGGTLFLWWLHGAPKDDVVVQYESAVKSASATQDAEAMNVYLRGLVELRPDDKRYRFQLALHQLDNGQEEAGLQHLRMLVDGAGYAPARLWLVNQAASAEPKLKITEEEAEQQLRMVLAEERGNLSANQMLARIYMSRGQLQSAEDCLLQATEELPQLSLTVAKIQKQLGRSEDLIQHHLGRAGEFFQQKLNQDPNNSAARIGRAETFLMQNKAPEAERLLKEGVMLQETPELLSALASLYGSMATQKLSESVLNREYCARLFARAIKLDPSNRSVIASALSVSRIGGQYTSGELSPAIEALKAQESESRQDQLLLAQLYAAAGNSTQAIEIVKPIAEVDVTMRPLLIRLLKAASMDDKARELIARTLDETQTSDRDAPLERQLDRAEALILNAQFSESLQLLRDVRDLFFDEPQDDSDSGVVQTDRNRVFLQRRWNVLFGQAGLEMFDEKLDADAFENSDEMVAILEEAWSANTVSIGILERLVKISCSERQYAEEADRILTRFLASGASSESIYNLLGSQALQLEDYEKAQKYLERAHSLSKKNPMVMNNLALALVRGTESDAKRALNLANDVLKILPDHADALSTRGEVYIAMNQWEDARRDLEVALPHRPKSRNARELMARVYDELGESALAKEHRRILETLDAPAEESQGDSE